MPEGASSWRWLLNNWWFNQDGFCPPRRRWTGAVGWAIFPEMGKRHVLVANFREPLPAGRGTLVVTMESSTLPTSIPDTSSFGHERPARCRWKEPDRIVKILAIKAKAGLK